MFTRLLTQLKLTKAILQAVQVDNQTDPSNWATDAVAPQNTGPRHGNTSRNDTTMSLYTKFGVLNTLYEKLSNLFFETGWWLGLVSLPQFISSDPSKPSTRSLRSQRQLWQPTMCQHWKSKVDEDTISNGKSLGFAKPLYSSQPPSSSEAHQRFRPLAQAGCSNHGEPHTIIVAKPYHQVSRKLFMPQ